VTQRTTGEVVVACPAPVGAGGLGHHLAQVIEDLRDTGTVPFVYAHSAPPSGVAGSAVDRRLTDVALRLPPLRSSPPLRAHATARLFDRAVAARLHAHRPAELVGFSTAALRSMRAARDHGARRITLEAPNSHLDHVWRRHREAQRAHPIERSWLGDALREVGRREYAVADRITVASEYTWRSFVDAGIPEHRLQRRRLHAHPRFTPAPMRQKDGRFRIVYVGALTVAKGTALLLDAFAKLAEPDAELVLVGGWTTRAMRRHVEAAMARDLRVRLAPGDPLPHLRAATVLVHPSYEDGFALAPVEALACGVPVVVSADTGMAELVSEGVNGYVVPTGDVDAVVERLRALAAAPLQVVTASGIRG
jgi:glycosyltransferase involved in cell wall biosynthesis